MTPVTPPQPKQWESQAWVPALAGMWWLWAGEGLGWLFWGLIPGALLTATGVALLLFPGDRRVTEYMALGGLLGLLLAPLALFAGALFTSLLAVGLSAAAYLVAGRMSLIHEGPIADAPTPDLTPAVCAKAALDEALLAYFVGTARMPDAEAVTRHVAALDAFESLAKDENWERHPEKLHRAPPDPGSTQTTSARTLGHAYEVLNYDSGFEARADLPGAEEWNAHRGNRRSQAWVLRHSTPTPTWLLCVHGYRMGLPLLDFGLFRPGWLHHKLGLNLMMPVLPLHGERRIGLRSGDGYLEGDPTLLFHAQTQALWDLRRAIRWIRLQDAQARIGVLGFSMGGYNAALLAQYEPDLDFVIAGIPAVDFPEAIWRHTPPLHQRYYEAQGFTLPRIQGVMRPLSPLSRAPLVPERARYIFAGSADRVVIPSQPLRLAQHWKVPVQWYAGGHLTFRSEPGVRLHIETAMTRAGWDLEPSATATA